MLQSVASGVQAFDARSFPTPRGDGVSTMILLTILVKRVEGKVKAYAAIVPDTSREDPRYVEASAWVHKNGNPLSYKAALAVWPGLEEWEYAR